MEIDAIQGMVNILQKHRPRLIVELHQGVDREDLLRTIISAGYDSHALPIEYQGDVVKCDLLNDKSYLFLPAK